MNAAAGEEAAQSPERVTPGELLRRERERLRLSIREAAEEMHLDASIVEAIEANRFVALGAPVYAKGHLRKYATLLGLAPELVIARYVALSDVPVEPTPIPASVNAPPRTERISLKTPLLVAGLADCRGGGVVDRRSFDESWFTRCDRACRGAADSAERRLRFRGDPRSGGSSRAAEPRAAERCRAGRRRADRRRSEGARRRRSRLDRFGGPPAPGVQRRVVGGGLRRRGRQTDVRYGRGGTRAHFVRNAAAACDARRRVGGQRTSQ